MTHPSYLEAKAARKVLIMADVDPFSVSDEEVRRATRILRERGDYLSMCHRRSPKYKPSKAREKARTATSDPVRYATVEVLRLVDYLRIQDSSDARSALQQINEATQ